MRFRLEKMKTALFWVLLVGVMGDLYRRLSSFFKGVI
jgi:ABC-type enterochelin transport system permease subunit